MGCVCIVTSITLQKLSGEKRKYNSNKGNGSNKRSKCKESSYGLKELTTLMEGAKSKKQKSKVRDILLLAADLLTQDSETGSSSDDSDSSIEEKRSRRKKLKLFIRKRK